MEVQQLINHFVQRLRIQRYSEATIRNYKSALESFLRLASQKFSLCKSVSPLFIDKNGLKILRI